MEKTLLEEFEDYMMNKNNNYSFDELNSLSPTKILLLICEKKQKMTNITGLKNIEEYTQTDEFENEILDILNIPNLIKQF